MERYIGKMLDNRYEILEVIGHGGMAVVFKAKCHRLNRLVAVKVLKPELADDADFRRRFHDESQAVAMLSHPNIVSVYDVSRGGDLEYIVMELIDGITLKQYMQRRGHLNWRESLHFITQVMKGLSHAHSRGIIHRDIKPQNIMILRDGSVKVADFGIARLMEKSGQTVAGSEALGSVHYISPEQAKGDRTDERSDIYSAGVVLYEMLTNRLPFEGENAVSIAIQHFTAAPLNPREIDSNIPVALEKICLKAMAPQISNRYKSADEMLWDLEEFRKNPEIDFDYDVAELRNEKDLDEPTQFIDRKELHKMSQTGEESRKRPGLSPAKTGILAAAGLIAGILLIVGLYKVIFASFLPKTPAEYAVPDLLGMTVEEAMEHPEVKDIFTVKEVAHRESEEYEEGQIMEQEPGDGDTAEKDTVIEVTVSTGIPSDTMPNVVGHERISAKLILDQMKLNLQYEYEDVYDDSVPAGKVISTDPAHNMPIQEGDTIVLTISKGPQPQTMIRLTGMTRENAEKVVKQMGLYATFVEVESSEYEAGIIVDQSIASETSVLPGDTIILTVSKGKPQEPEPEPDPDTGTPDGGDGETTDPENPPVDPGVPGEPSEPISGESEIQSGVQP